MPWYPLHDIKAAVRTMLTQGNGRLCCMRPIGGRGTSTPLRRPSLRRDVADISSNHKHTDACGGICHWRVEGRCCRIKLAKCSSVQPLSQALDQPADTVSRHPLDRGSGI